MFYNLTNLYKAPTGDINFNDFIDAITPFDETHFSGVKLDDAKEPVKIKTE